MEIVIDSHALFWFLTGNPKLSAKAKRLVTQAEQVIVPSIGLMEILYLLEKNKMSPRFIEVLEELKMKNYLVYPLDLNIVSQTLFISSELEMHDRIIVATANIFKAPLVSKDAKIEEFYQGTVW